MGWVDLWRGILICDVLKDSPELRYIPLPSPLVPRTLKGPPLYVRDIIVVEGYIKYFEMCSHVGPEAWKAATWERKDSWNEWKKDCVIEVSKYPAHTNPDQQEAGTKNALVAGAGEERRRDGEESERTLFLDNDATAAARNPNLDLLGSRPPNGERRETHGLHHLTQARRPTEARKTAGSPGGGQSVRVHLSQPRFWDSFLKKFRCSLNWTKFGKFGQVSSYVDQSNKPNLNEI
jgi:hypothetical protein